MNFNENYASKNKMVDLMEELHHLNNNNNNDLNNEF